MYRISQKHDLAGKGYSGTSMQRRPKGLTKFVRHKVDQFMFLGNCPPTPPLSQHCLTSQLGKNVGLGEGSVGSVPET